MGNRRGAGLHRETMRHPSPHQKLPWGPKGGSTPDLPYRVGMRLVWEIHSPWLGEADSVGVSKVLVMRQRAG